MKRSELRRTKGLSRSSGLTRTPFKRRPKPKGTDLDAASAWWVEVVGPVNNRQACAQCGSKNNIEGHHIVSKHAIKRLALGERWDRDRREQALWDSRNGMPVCRLCHARHESATSRLPRSLVPPRAFEFADELGLRHLIERYYPE